MSNENAVYLSLGSFARQRRERVRRRLLAAYAVVAAALLLAMSWLVRQ